MKQNKIYEKLPIFISLFIVGIYLFYALYHAVNVLFYDDIHLLETVLWMEQTPNWVEKYNLIILQHNEHRIIVPRFIAWLVYKAQGEVNWITMLTIGNLAWCGVCWLLWRVFQQMKLSNWFFIPIPLLIYQPQYIDNITNYSISTLQQSGIIFLYFLILHYISQKRTYLPIIIACIATFTHGSGIFSFLVAILLLGYQRRWSEIKWWVIAGVLMAMWFFYGYAGGQNAKVGESLGNPIRLIQSGMAFLGASITAFDRAGVSIMPAVILGAAIVGVAIRFVVKNWNSKQPYIVFLFGTILFIGLTVALVAVSRSWQGIETLIAARYIHYSPLAIALCYLMLLNIWPRFTKQIGWVIFVYALVFNLASYYKYTPQIIGRSRALEAEKYNWPKHQTFINADYSPRFLMNIGFIVKDAEKAGVSCISKQAWDLPNTKTIDSTLKFEVNFDNHPQEPTIKLGHLTNTTTTDYSGFVVLEHMSTSNYYVYAMVPRENAKSAFLKTFHYTKPGFYSIFVVNALPAGKYRIGIYLNKNFVMSNQYITI